MKAGEQQGRRSGSTILVLDDDPDLRQTLGDILEARGYAVSMAAEGAAAVALAGRKRPPVALVDLRLQDMPGLEALAGIRQTSPWTECIVLTGHASQSSAIEASNLGIFGYLLKPYDMDQLLLLIQRAVEKHEARQEVHAKNRTLEAINAVFQKALSCDSEQELAARCLEVAEELTGSKFGLLGELNSAGLFDTLAISNPGWEACEMSQEEARASIVDMPLTGVDRATLRDEEPRIVNDLAGHPDSVSVPAGHPKVTCFLGVPFKDGGRTIGMIGLANKDGGYDRADQEAVEALSVAVSEALMRQRAEAARQQTEDLYRTLVEMSPDAIVLCDLDYRIVKASRQGAVMLGLESADDLVGRSPLDILEPGDRERARSNLEQLVETGGSIQNEYTARGGNGARFTVAVSTRLVRTADDLPRGLISIIRDVTELKKMEATLAQSDRMASVGMLAAGVAHEINNPLTYMLYNLELINKDLPAVIRVLRRCLSALDQRQGGELAELMEQARELTTGEQLDELVACAREAAEGSARVRDIVRDLKTFSRIEEERPVPVDLNRVVEGAANMAHNEIKYRARMVKDLGRIPRVLGTDGRLSQVFLNLLVNAAQAMDEGDVEHNTIRIRTRAFDGEVQVEVSDTGKGMAPEQLEHIFEPFFSTKEAGVGSGLGLSICHRIIAEFGGRIEADSEPGEGTRFVVSLPITEQDAPQPRRPRTTGNKPPAPRRRVLVVDDDPQVGRALARLLKGEHDVVLAGSGVSGKEVLEQEVFDLILCDMMMPEVSGMDLYEWLEERAPEQARRMVFMSGGVFTPRAREFLEQVENARLEKPFEPANLRAMVRALSEA